MRNSLSFLVAAFMLLAGSTFAQPRRIDMNFEGQMSAAIEELQAKMDVDPQVKGQKVRLGRFTGPNLPDSSFDLEFENQVEKLLANRLAKKSDFIVNGTYNILPGEQQENKNLTVIQFKITISRKFRELQSVTREINSSADIIRITGATISIPVTTDIEKRNRAAADAIMEPSFGVKNNFMVTTKSPSKYAVAIFKKKGGTGKPTPVVPENINGFAFVDLNVSDTFSIALYNFNTKTDAVGKISIDGLDVVNTFSTDGTTYQGYTIKKAATLEKPSEHRVPGWLKTTKSKQGNVFEFVVNKLGEGAASEKQSRNKIGVIHVAFFEPDLSGGRKGVPRGDVEVGKGKPLDVDYEVKSVALSITPVANISIRYNIPRK